MATACDHDNSDNNKVEQVSFEPNNRPISLENEISNMPEDDEHTSIQRSTNVNASLDISNANDEDPYKHIQIKYGHEIDTSNLITLEWDQRLQFFANTETKKKIKEKLLIKHKGMFIVDYRKIWNHNGDTYSMIPTDLIMILKDQVTIEEIKKKLIGKLNELGFNLKISTLNGGESFNF